MTVKGVAAMKKRAAQLCFYSVYCLLALLGALIDFGIFAGKFSTRPFVYYTSLSNMVCGVFMLISFVRSARKKDYDHGLMPFCKYIFVIMILLTALAYNLLLNRYNSLNAYFADIKNCLYHLILPVMFFVDWLVFYRRGTVKWLYPLAALAIPVVYVIYILARAAVVNAAGRTLAIAYPYFFLNVERLGWSGFGLWMATLLIGLIVLGYGLYTLDRLLCRKACCTAG